MRVATTDGHEWTRIYGEPPGRRRSQRWEVRTWRQCNLVFKNSVNARPHPGPLPQERENRLLVLEKLEAGIGARDLRENENARLRSPLPGGEGQGEGERPSNFLEGSG